MTTTAAYLGIFEENASGNFVHIATSVNTVEQKVGQDSVWQFEETVLSGTKIRLCLMASRTSTALNTSLVLSGRGVNKDTDGCYLINTSGSNENYLIAATFTLGIPGALFTPASHETNTTLHLSEEEHAGLAQLLANKDALLALINN